MSSKVTATDQRRANDSMMVRGERVGFGRHEDIVALVTRKASYDNVAHEFASGGDVPERVDA